MVFVYRFCDFPFFGAQKIQQTQYAAHITQYAAHITQDAVHMAQYAAQITQ